MDDLSLPPFTGKKNLGGRTILITRPQLEAQETAHEVLAWQGHPLLAPALVIEPLFETPSWRAAIANLEHYIGIILTSANGARALLDLCGHHLERIQNTPLFCVGPKTAAIFSAVGLTPFTPKEATDAVQLAELILLMQSDKKGRMLFLRAQEGRDTLVERLLQAGLQIDLVTAYQARPFGPQPEWVIDQLQQKKIDAVTFFSTRSAECFIDALDNKSLLKNTILAALSPGIADKLNQMGFPAAIVAAKPTSGDLLYALADFWYHHT
ncbi:MAG: uroporphyrinogen-III synthase [Magnetococcus sp. DMHC-6]